MITVYSTGCPKCKILEKKLTDKGIEFEVVTDNLKVLSAADKADTDFVPILEVDGIFMDFNKAEEWIGENNQ